MNINRTLSFKANIPVFFYAKNPANNKYVPVMKNENIRKCQSFVARNLNGTAKNCKDDGFVEFYKMHDNDYANRPEIHSVYQQKGPMLYMVTGDEVDSVREMAKHVGIAKADSIEALGHTKSFEVSLAGQKYRDAVASFLHFSSKPVRTKDKSQKLALHLLFNPEYKKKSGALKGFQFVCAKFVTQDTKEIVDEYISQK